LPRNPYTIYNGAALSIASLLHLIELSLLLIDAGQFLMMVGGGLLCLKELKLSVNVFENMEDNHNGR
jgi:hypothetical protein